ncbi:unnamed protein product [Spirodela intermedia]|uniref:Exostosin GT47 domain-containing protein n=1 Tax=Spirodela intermedia TaxID=51605 RepID=A0ABN7EB25_SPIIN|nr:unnamed protein product [Spirodela intermedia]
MPPDAKRHGSALFHHHYHHREATTAIPMKFIHRKTHQDRAHILPKRYLQWVVWLSLSLCIFFLSTFSTAPHFRRPHQHSFLRKHTSLASRALIAAGDSELPGGAALPDSLYNRDWLANPRCATHLFAAEVALHETLLRSPVRTLDPHAANFFFVPVYVSCNFSTANGFPALGHARSLLSSAVDFISSRHPFWGLRGGADHVFVASHDYGACFHAMEDVAVAEGIPEFLRRSIILQTFGVDRPHACQDVEHLLQRPAPPSVATPPVRDIWVYFRGKMEVHPRTSAAGSTANLAALRRRPAVLPEEEAARRVPVGDGAVGLLPCPRGWAPWSPRLVESVAVGCVPVVIADGIRLPFSNAVRWDHISLRVPEREVTRLEPILRHVAATNLSAIQRNLWDPANREALLFNRRMKPGDATWHVLKALSAKIHRR